MRNWMKLTIVGSLTVIALTLTALVFMRPEAASTKSTSADNEAELTASEAGSSQSSTGRPAAGGTHTGSPTADPQASPTTVVAPPTTLVAPPAGGGGGGKPVVDTADPTHGGVLDPADGPVVRDHRGDGNQGGGVVVTPTDDGPVVRDHRGEGDGPIVRDHRGEGDSDSGPICQLFGC